MAVSDPAMWKAIVATNGDEISAAMDDFTEVWGRLRDAVGRGDLATVEKLMHSAAAFKGSKKR